MKVLLLFAFLCCVFYSNAQITTSDLLGEWQMITDTPIGDRKQNFTFKSQNNQLIGVTKNGEVEITLKENMLQWENIVRTPFGKIEILVEGIIEDNKIINGFSTPKKGHKKGRKFTWVMKRKG